MEASNPLHVGTATIMAMQLNVFLAFQSKVAFYNLYFPLIS